jgi:serine/threonine-protein kinase
VTLQGAGDPFVGRDLDGRYTIAEKLGEGGMGAVYRARQHSMGREVAVKVLAPSLVRDASAIKRFLREAKLASRLAHPNIVSVLDFGQTHDGVFYLVMELVNGRTLQEELVRVGKLPLPRILRIATQICDALEAAHALPIIHRDLKPANVMLLTTGRDPVKVLDFGLAKSLSAEASSMMTSSGALLGTPTFMPPEVANGLPVDDRADQYSLGCMLFVMACGRPPFVTESIPEMIAMHGTVPAPPVRGVPKPVAAVIDRLLLKHPEDRYESAAAVRDALEQAVAMSSGFSEVAHADTLDAPAPPADVGMQTQDSESPQRPSELAMTRRFQTPFPPEPSGMIPPSEPRKVVQAAPSIAYVPADVPAPRRPWRRPAVLGAFVGGIAAIAGLVSYRLVSHDASGAKPAIVEPATSDASIEEAVAASPDAGVVEPTGTPEDSTAGSGSAKTVTTKPPHGKPPRTRPSGRGSASTSTSTPPTTGTGSSGSTHGTGSGSEASPF